MEKDSSPDAVEDKCVQQFFVKWIFTLHKFAFKRTNSGMNDTWPLISLHKRQTLTQWNSVVKLKIDCWNFQRKAFVFLSY